MSKNKLSLIGVQETVTEDMEKVSKQDIAAYTNKSAETEINQDVFYTKLKEFDKTDFKKDWKNHELLSNRYHIRIFVLEDEIKKASNLLVHDVDGALKKASETIASREYTNIAKIIRVGQGVTDPEYKEGDLVLLCKAEVCGKALNPTYVQALQYSRSFGGEQPIVPPGTPQNVPAIQARFGEYYLTKPHQFNEPIHKIHDFAIPPHKIVERYKLQ